MLFTNSFKCEDHVYFTAHMHWNYSNKKTNFREVRIFNFSRKFCLIFFENRQFDFDFETNLFFILALYKYSLSLAYVGDLHNYA